MASDDVAARRCNASRYSHHTRCASRCSRESAEARGAAATGVAIAAAGFATCDFVADGFDGDAVQPTVMDSMNAAPIWRRRMFPLTLDLPSRVQPQAHLRGQRSGRCVRAVWSLAVSPRASAICTFRRVRPGRSPNEVRSRGPRHRASTGPLHW